MGSNRVSKNLKNLARDVEELERSRDNWAKEANLQGANVEYWKECHKTASEKLSQAEQSIALLQAKLDATTVQVRTAPESVGDISLSLSDYVESLVKKAEEEGTAKLPNGNDVHFAKLPDGLEIFTINQIIYTRKEVLWRITELTIQDLNIRQRDHRCGPGRKTVY